MSEDRIQAAREALYCETILAKTGDNVLLAALDGANAIETWAHFPKGDVFDPESGAQWYYHCHPREEGMTEHGHFHCFLRPAGAQGPVHHLVAVGVDAHGQLMRLFTVNQWVVGDTWLDARQTIALLPRFNAETARPSYLVNRWLTAVLRLYQAEIADLIAARDKTIAAHKPASGGVPKEDRDLEVTSEMPVSLRETAKTLGL